MKQAAIYPPWRKTPYGHNSGGFTASRVGREWWLFNQALCGRFRLLVSAKKFAEDWRRFGWLAARERRGA